MRRTILDVSSHWPPSPDGYDYLKTAGKPDWAWEYLRRNQDYRSSARSRFSRGCVRVRLSEGPSLTRLRARAPHAEAWGLCCFR